MDKGTAVNKIGQIVAGEYEICHAELIGHGAFACVYRGRKIKVLLFVHSLYSLTHVSLLCRTRVFLLL